MRAEYDFTDSKPNPYAKRLRRPVTMRIDVEAIDYFKPLMAGEPKLIMDGAVPATIVPFNKR